MKGVFYIFIFLLCSCIDGRRVACVPIKNISHDGWEYIVEELEYIG